VTRSRFTLLRWALPIAISSPLEQFRDVKLARIFRIDLFRVLFLGISRLGVFALLSRGLVIAFRTLSVRVIPTR
jgi:hypothetical protein